MHVCPAPGSNDARNPPVTDSDTPRPGRRQTSRAWWAAALFTAVLTAACGAETTEVTLSAASSLTELAEAIETDIEAAHPEIDVRLNLGGSAGLVAQIREGAPVDILLAADSIALPADDPLVRQSASLATNQMVLVTDPASPLTLDDLGDPSLRIAACDPSLPCGRLAQRVIETPALAPLDITADSLEQNVRLVRQRVLSGDADLGFVYRTDTLGQPLRIIELPDHDETPRNTVTASRLTDGQHTMTVMAFLTDSPTLDATAAALGFGAP